MTIKSMLRGSALITALMLSDTGWRMRRRSQRQVATPDDTSEDIVVTGSRIRQNPLNQDSPVVTVDEAAIGRTGLSSIADVLQRLPSASGGLNSKVNNSGNIGNPPDGGGVGAGAAEIDLRYLGSKRTLVLVDGLRYVAGASASGIPSTVDLNTIPASMIERVEVLQNGASPQYGSDAIAGVVNVITKQSQPGLQLSAQFGTYRQGDGHTQDYQLSYGVKGPTTSIVFGATYVKQDPVFAKDRAISQFPNPGQTSCTDPVGGCSGATPNGRFLLGSFGDLTLKSNPIMGRPVFDPTLVGGDFRAFTAADRFNFAPFNYFLTPSERYGFFLSAKQELGSDITLRVKAVYNRRNSQNQAAFLPLFVGPDAGNGAGSLLDTLSIDGTNPYNPFGTLSAGGPGNPPANYSFVARRLVEAGQRTYTQKVDTMSLTGTLDGSFQVGDHKWYWDVNAVIGLNDAHQLFTGNVNAAKLAQALGPVANCTAPCVPFNIFGGAGSVTPAMLAWVGFDERDKSSQRLGDYTANLSGDLFDLPAGPVGFAVGYEHRDQHGELHSRSGDRGGARRGHPVGSGDRRLQCRRSLWRVARSVAEGNAVLPLARGRRGGAAFELFDQRLQHDLYRQRGVEAGTRPVAARILCQGLPRPEHRRVVRRADAFRPADDRSVLEHSRIALRNVRDRARQLYRQWCSRQWQLCGTPGASCR